MYHRLRQALHSQSPLFSYSLIRSQGSGRVLSHMTNRRHLSTRVQFVSWLALIGGTACAQLHFHSSTRVAIIGAGSAGSSAAYHLHQYAPDVNMTVFEKNSYIGGRSTSVQIQDDPLEVAELGASIFVDANYILGNASKTFNLELEDTVGPPDTIGV